jgi:pimeloyl-ACP methyl ester carboxylesterase
MNTLILYVGGFTASHEKMTKFHFLFKNRGVQYLAVQLPGHPVSIERSSDGEERSNAKLLAQYSASDWQNTILDVYRSIIRSKNIERIIFVGHSMGAYLSILTVLKQAETEPELQKLAGVVMISTPFEGKLKKKYAYFLKLANLAKIPFMGCRLYHKGGEPGSNQYVALKSVNELVRVIRKGMASLPYVQVPVLLFNFKQDPSVQMESAKAILECLPDEIREKSRSIILEGDRHTPSEDDQATIVDEILRFFQVA